MAEQRPPPRPPRPDPRVEQVGPIPPFRPIRRQVPRVPSDEPPVPPPLPQRSLSPTGVRVEAGEEHVSFRAKLPRWLLKALWVVVGPLVLSVVGFVVGYIKGRIEGLMDQWRELTVTQEQVKDLAQAELRFETRTKSDLDRAFQLLQDHDRRIPRVERAIADAPPVTIEGKPPTK